jgi:hypothetical protein
LSKRELLGVQENVNSAIQRLSVLDHDYFRGIIERDLKPAIARLEYLIDLAD